MIKSLIALALFASSAAAMAHDLTGPISDLRAKVEAAQDDFNQANCTGDEFEAACTYSTQAQLVIDILNDIRLTDTDEMARHKVKLARQALMMFDEGAFRQATIASLTDSQADLLDKGLVIASRAQADALNIVYPRK
ncbi:TPA: hypothetical protein LU109_003617 [Enterobacter hormaechei subsp. xiangfangensis]|nr:hypothetical protein [Enterobacter hormaechei subsp. xiangfangensis]